MNGVVYFIRTLCVLQAPSKKMTLVLGKVDNGLYKLLLPSSSTAGFFSSYSSPIMFDSCKSSSDVANSVSVMHESINKINIF